MAGRALVTGAGGFIGSHVVADLVCRSWSVRALDLAPERGDPPGVENVRGDVRDAGVVGEAVQGVDVVFHLASKHLELGLPDAVYREVNVEGTRRLLEASAWAGVRRFVYCGTTGVHGHIARPPADEDAPCRADIIYERTKWEAEAVVREIGARSGIEAVIVRPAWVYGPRCPRTTRLFHSARKGRMLMVGDGTCLRHPIYIADMLAGLRLAAEVPAAAGRTYILGGEAAVPVGELIGAVARVVGRRLRILRLSPRVARPLFRAVEAAALAAGRTPPVSPRSLKFFLQQTAYDISRARRELGFSPRYPLAAGLQETYGWLKAQHGWE